VKIFYKFRDLFYHSYVSVIYMMTVYTVCEAEIFKNYLSFSLLPL